MATQNKNKPKTVLVPRGTTLKAGLLYIENLHALSQEKLRDLNEQFKGQLCKEVPADQAPGDDK